MRTYNEPEEVAWSLAFSDVREMNRPAIVLINGKKRKLYPSGRALCAENFPYHDLTDCNCDEPSDGVEIMTITRADLRKAFRK
jgi:hypothetical protein